MPVLMLPSALHGGIFTLESSASSRENSGSSHFDEGFGGDGCRTSCSVQRMKD